MQSMSENEDDFNDGYPESGESEEPASPPQGFAAPAPQVPAEKPRNRGGRPRKNPLPGTNAADWAPPVPKQEAPESWPKEAVDLWPYLLAWLAGGLNKTREPMGADTVRIELMRLGAGQPPTPLPPGFDGHSVTGAEGYPPGEALRDHIIDNYHMPIAQGPMKYHVQFKWKNSGKTIRNGEIYLPAPAEIRMLRAARTNAEQQQQQIPQNGFAGAPYARPPQQPQYPQAPQYPQYQQPQYPQQYPQQSSDNRIVDPALRAEVNDLRVLVSALVGKLEGRPPAPVTSPPPQTSEERIAHAVVGALVGMGVIPQGHVPAAPAAVPQGPARATHAAEPEDPVDAMEKYMTKMVRLKKMGRMIGQLMGDEVDAVAEPMPETPSAPPPPSTGWEAMETGGKWPDGSSVRFAKKKDGTGIDWGGFIFENGYVGARVMDLAENTLRPIGEAAQKLVTGAVSVVGPEKQPQENDSGKAEVVNNIPTSAVPVT